MKKKQEDEEGEDEEGAGWRSPEGWDCHGGGHR